MPLDLAYTGMKTNVDWKARVKSKTATHKDANRMSFNKDKSNIFDLGRFLCFWEDIENLRMNLEFFILASVLI